MAVLTDLHIWSLLFQIAFINLLLSGDNAVVIALAVRKLRRRERILGQIWGTVGAVVLRLAFVAIMAALFHVPLVRALGGFLLVWIALKLVRPEEIGEGHGGH